MQLKLSLALRSDRARLGIPPALRLVFAGLFAFALTGAFDGGINGPALALAGFCALAGLYDESWVFLPARNLVEFRFGLLFLFRRRRYALDEVEAFVYSAYARKLPHPSGLPGRRIHELKLRLSDGGAAGLETIAGRGGERLRRTAERLAEFCGKPMIEESE